MCMEEPVLNPPAKCIYMSIPLATAGRNDEWHDDGVPYVTVAKWPVVDVMAIFHVKS